MKIDPFKHVGSPKDWAPFGAGEHDERCDAERRAMGDYMARRLNKSARRNNTENAAVDLLTGGFVAFAGLYIASGGGPDRLSDDDFEKWIGIATFAWYQAMSCFDAGSVQ